ncbi:DUF6273 domain-containing protein [Tissierella carlieri]|uniref:DUF6273 domain-containing protein n=1 Tax=Tissierella carlieri TaxID=689904 RepID=UPI0038680814
MNKYNKKISMCLVILTLLSSFTMIFSNEADASTGTMLSNLPLGSVVYDPSWTWQYRNEEDYTGYGVTKPVGWIIVAKNHTGYPSNSITLISDDVIGLHPFDNSTNRGNTYGSNHWGNSGSPNATLATRTFLNSTFYNAMSTTFKNSIMTTTLDNKTYDGSSYTTSDKVFIPSLTELGYVDTKNRIVQPIGYKWAYSDNSSFKRNFSN